MRSEKDGIGLLAKLELLKIVQRKVETGDYFFFFKKLNDDTK